MQKMKIKNLIPAVAMVAAPVLLAVSAVGNVSAISYNGGGLGPDGRFHLQMVPPTTEDEKYVVNEAIGELAEGWGITSGGVWNCNETVTSCKLVYHGSEWTDDYYGIVYEYNANVKNRIDALFSTTGVPEDGFYVWDLELLNYWVYSGNTLASFSGAVKNLFLGYNVDFMVDVRGGGGHPLLTSEIGIGKLFYDGVLYEIEGMTGVVAPHIFYVPSDTADDKLTEALMDRIALTYGEEARDLVSIVKTDDKVSDFVEESDQQTYFYFEDYMNADVYEIDIDAGEGLGAAYTLIIVKDSDKMHAADGVNSTDLLTDVTISSEATNLPGDAQTYAYNFGNDDAEIANVIGSSEFSIYELGLYSEAMDGEISDNGGDVFTVVIPVPENLQGITRLSAYWMNFESGELEEHPATIVGEVAVFETNHFSTYILAESTPEPEPVIPLAPDTGVVK